MNIHTISASLGKITGYLVVVGILVVTLGCAPQGFRVSNIDLTPPDWVTPADYTYKVVVTITFNRSVDIATFSAPTTVKIDIKGTNDSRTTSDITGTFQVSSDSKTVVFISDQTLSELIHPQAGENLEYTITVMGTGTNVVKDTNGEALDGDLDGQSGGNFNKVITVIG